MDLRDSTVQPNSKVNFTTTSALLRNMLVDPLLERYSCITVYIGSDTNVALGASGELLLGLLRRRLGVVDQRDLRVVVVTKVAIDVPVYMRYFESYIGCVHFSCPYFPIQALFLDQPCPDYLVACLELVYSLLDKDTRNILVYVPTRADTAWMEEQLSSRRKDLSVVLVHEQTSIQAHYEHMKQHSKRRLVVVSTHVGENAMYYFPRIDVVIDCMLARLPGYDMDTYRHTLCIEPVSQSRAIQRANRAGRDQVGKVFRLCTEHDFLHVLSKRDVPEMQRRDLTSMLLQMKSLGVSNVLVFPYLNAPPAKAVVRALEELSGLGAIDDEGELTRLGVQLASLPMDPYLGRMLLCAVLEEKCALEGLTLAAMLSIGGSPFLNVGFCAYANQSKDKSDLGITFLGAKQGDHPLLVNIYSYFIKAEKQRAGETFCREYGLSIKKLRQARSMFEYLNRVVQRVIKSTCSDVVDMNASCGEDPLPFLRCVLAGKFGNIAKLGSNGGYTTLRDGIQVHLHPTCTFSKFGAPPMWICFDSATKQDKKIYLHTCSQIDPNDVIKCAPRMYTLMGSSAVTASKKPPIKDGASFMDSLFG